MLWKSPSNWNWRSALICQNVNKLLRIFRQLVHLMILDPFIKKIVKLNGDLHWFVKTQNVNKVHIFGDFWTFEFWILSWSSLICRNINKILWSFRGFVNSRILKPFVNKICQIEWRSALNSRNVNKLSRIFRVFVNSRISNPSVKKKKHGQIKWRSALIGRILQKWSWIYWGFVNSRILNPYVKKFVKLVHITVWIKNVENLDHRICCW